LSRIENGDYQFVAPDAILTPKEGGITVKVIGDGNTAPKLVEIM
jgi:hypothetical protein